MIDLETNGVPITGLAAGAATYDVQVSVKAADGSSAFDGVMEFGVTYGLGDRCWLQAIHEFDSWKPKPFSVSLTVTDPATNLAGISQFICAKHFI